MDKDRIERETAQDRLSMYVSIEAFSMVANQATKLRTSCPHVKYNPSPRYRVTIYEGSKQVCYSFDFGRSRVGGDKYHRCRNLGRWTKFVLTKTGSFLSKIPGI